MIRKQVYDFKLEQTMDEKVLLKTAEDAIEAGQRKALQVRRYQYRPYLWEPSSVRRSPDSIRIRPAGGYLYVIECTGERRPELRRIYSQGPDARTWQETATTISARDFPAES
ncbi:MAG: hypothetical protein ACLRPV_17675 [Lacrimispora saccharolytica]